MKRTPLKRKSATKRTTKSPRCANRQCKQIARVGDLCRSHAQREADRLFSLWVRRYGLCTGRNWRPPECSGNLQCAHIISRRYHAVRWEYTNAVPLCAAHHTYWTHRPLEWEEWVTTQLFVDYVFLRDSALHGPVPDLADVLADLRLRVAA